jgi:hypothetical protein
MRLRAVLLPFALTLSFVLSSCGGGGDAATPPSDPTSAPTPAPVAPPANPAIVLDQSEPLSGTVKLSIGGGYAFSSVEWYVDLKWQFTNLGESGNPWLWDTTKLPQGSFFVLARIQLPDGSYTDTRRTVTVSNANVSVTPAALRTSDGARLSVVADATVGVASVSIALDGTPLATLTEKNGCSTNSTFQGTCGWNLSRHYDTYQVFGPLPACSGQHTFVATVTDTAGNVKTVSVPVPVYPVPWLTLDSPKPDAVATGSLKIAGSVCADTPGPVGVWATLNGLPVFQTTVPQGPFSGTFDLTGFTAATYTLWADVGKPVGQGGSTTIVRSVKVESP